MLRFLLRFRELIVEKSLLSVLQDLNVSGKCVSLVVVVVLVVIIILHGGDSMLEKVEANCQTTLEWF